MHRFRKETAFTSENYLASSLVEKVLEQCYQESLLNPHGMKAIGLADASGSPYEISTSITDKETVFFSHPAITEDLTPDLHHLLKDNYTLSIETEKKDGFYEMVAGLKWKAQSGRGELFSSSRVLSFTGEKEVRTTFDLTDDAVEERLVKDVFSSPGSNLGAELSSVGAQTMLVHVGHVFYACRDWLNDPDFADKLQRAASLEVFTQPGSDEYARCSQLYFEMARDLLHLMLSLQPHSKGATDNISFSPAYRCPRGSSSKAASTGQACITGSCAASFSTAFSNFPKGMSSSSNMPIFSAASDRWWLVCSISTAFFTRIAHSAKKSAPA